MKKIAIKLLTPAEVPAIVALDQICLGGLWTREGYLREIDSDRSTLIILQLLHEKAQTQMIGMACLWSIVEEAHITLLAIHPEHRHQGLGQLLLIILLKDAIARQLEWATLEVNEYNLAALNLYQKYGFQIAGKRKNYYQPTGDDALVLWLKGIQQDTFKSNLIQWQQHLSDRLSKNSYYLKQTKFC
ncbi:MAG: ribosomal protein S18-alanine N-acetyltransferase [Pleurocapsa minor HA4230-MV1]|nr:ribosomal protein S18-alanine N-acetyltransferase [Pleurocapsa minor HA4230-MV1]